MFLRNVKEKDAEICGCIRGGKMKDETTNLYQNLCVEKNKGKNED